MGKALVKPVNIRQPGKGLVFHMEYVHQWEMLGPVMTTRLLNDFLVV